MLVKKMVEQSQNIYRAEFVSGLFDEMAQSYGVVNVVSSFGFCVGWRRRCVALAGVAPGSRVVDLMSGMGELWPMIAQRIGSNGHITSVDFSEVMCRNSSKRTRRLPASAINVRQEDVLNNSIPDNSADVVLCSFGLKTFSDEQRRELAKQVARMLRPGGKLSFVEISVPPSRLLRPLYFFYLNYVIPLFGRALLGNPDNYRMLGIYTTAFGSCAGFAGECASAGLRVHHQRLFFGCATAVVGEKPKERISKPSLPRFGRN